MTKIVSLHMEPCFRYCPHVKICYHKNKNTDWSTDGTDLIDFKRRTWMLRKKDWEVYESVCNELKPMHAQLLKQYKNYNVTISCDQYEHYFDNVQDQVQLTVYNADQAEMYKDFQKLFLVKDDDTWNYFTNHWNLGFGTYKMHYIFEQSYITKEKLRIAAENKNLSNGNITVDSCFTSFIVNGRCPYSYNNYIDLTFDGTVRSCPYVKTGVKIKKGLFKLPYFEWEKEIEKLFGVKTGSKRCMYKELFGGLLDV